MGVFSVMLFLKKYLKLFVPMIIIVLRHKRFQHDGSVTIHHRKSEARYTNM